jgi:hypothetical protein
MANVYKTGYQGSETSWVEVILYSHGDDPLVMLPDGMGRYPFSGKRADSRHPSLVSVSTQKMLGAASGSFTIDIKPSLAAANLFQHICDDDWVDIVFYRHSQPWHVMRGLIDEIRRNRSVGGSGATTRSYTLTGRDFAKIWEITPVWFSPCGDKDMVSDAWATMIFQAIPSLRGTPPEAVKAFLWNFMEAVTVTAGVNWEMPAGMPNGGGSFLKWVQFNDNHYYNTPARKSFNPNFLDPNNTLWATAQQHADPAFVEVYADMLPDGGPFDARLQSGEPLAPKDARMTVVVRDRPFPVVDPLIDSWPISWDAVPQFTVFRQQIVTDNVGRSGLERFNAFFVASQLHQEAFGQNSLNILTPLVDFQSLHRHGLRRFDVQSSMSPDQLDFSKLCEQQRRIAKDWHCLNPYFLSGTINLGIGRPDIKIGCKVRIPGEHGERDQETYYIESVGHNWRFGQGIRTALGVTRGWMGSDQSMVAALQQMSARYQEPQLLTDVSWLQWQ